MDCHVELVKQIACLEGIIGVVGGNGIESQSVSRVVALYVERQNQKRADCGGVLKGPNLRDSYLPFRGFPHEHGYGAC